MKDLINWKELSRRLAGNQTSISRNRIPKKYQSKVDELLSVLKNWDKERNNKVYKAEAEKK